MENANDLLFRCSSLSHLMTEPKKKGEVISETAKTHLVDVFVSRKYNRFSEISGKQLDKGNETEEDSISIYSRINKIYLKKNQESLKNEFICGTPDLYIGESVNKASKIIDCKSSWDIFTFHRAINKELLDSYYWQGQGYMALTGATNCSIVYCLNNTPYHLVEGELRKESYKYPDADTPAWVELQIIANHVYDKATFDNYISIRGISLNKEYAKVVYDGFVEVPLKERYFSFDFNRSDEDIEKLYEKIKVCRKYMNEKFFSSK